MAPVFPTNLPGLTWSIFRRPTWSTIENISADGREVLYPQQAFPLWEFEVTFGFLRDQTQNSDPYQPYAGRSEFTRLSQFFYAMAGQYGNFYFADPTDCNRTGQVLGELLPGGATQIFTATRDYGIGDQVISGEPVGGINQLYTVYLSGVPLPGFNYSFSGNQVTVTGVAGSGQLTMDFSFYYLCRFLDDKIEFEESMKNLSSLKSLRFRSVKSAD